MIKWYTIWYNINTNQPYRGATRLQYLAAQTMTKAKSALWARESRELCNARMHSRPYTFDRKKLYYWANIAEYYEKNYELGVKIKKSTQIPYGFQNYVDSPYLRYKYENEIARVWAGYKAENELCDDDMFIDILYSQMPSSALSADEIALLREVYLYSSKRRLKYRLIRRSCHTSKKTVMCRNFIEFVKEYNNKYSKDYTTCDLDFFKRFRIHCEKSNLNYDYRKAYKLVHYLTPDCFSRDDVFYITRDRKKDVNDLFKCFNVLHQQKK